MSSSYNLRPATPHDIEAVLHFWRQHAEGTDRTDDHDAVDRLLRRDPEALVLAVESDQIIGSVIAGWDGWRCHLYRIAVRQDRRCQGVARALIAWAEARFHDVGGHRADAMVLQDNALGQAAWSSLGYAPQEEWRRWVKRVTQPG